MVVDFRLPYVEACLSISVDEACQFQIIFEGDQEAERDEMRAKY